MASQQDEFALQLHRCVVIPALPGVGAQAPGLSALRAPALHGAQAAVAGIPPSRHVDGVADDRGRCVASLAAEVGPLAPRLVGDVQDLHGPPGLLAPDDVNLPVQSGGGSCSCRML